MRLYRIVDARHAQTSFSGQASLGHPARWHSGRLPVIYTATTQPLAALEVLVHLQDRSQLEHYRIIPCTVDDALVAPVPDDLPGDWHHSRGTRESRAYGDAWLQSRTSHGLEVPSALAEGTNVLLNPQHPAHKKIQISGPEPLREPLWS